MKIITIKDEALRGFMVNVSRFEALQIITSLATQMAKRSNINGRKEFYTEDTNEYFSIAVDEDK